MEQKRHVPSETVAGGSLSKEAAFQILSNDRRRYVLHYLDGEPDGRAPLGDIATRIAAWENEIPVEEVSSTERKRVYIALHQTHLPKMAEMGVVDYDSDGNVVTLEPDSADLRAYLEMGGQSSLPWGRFYVAFGVVAVGLVVGVAGDLGPLAAIPPVWWAGLIAVAVLVSGAYQTYREGSIGGDGDGFQFDR